MFWKKLGIVGLVLVSFLGMAKFEAPVLAVNGIPKGWLTQGKTELDSAGIDPAIKGDEVPNNVVDYVLAIVNWLLLFVGICMLVVIIYLGFRLLISGSDDSQMENAKKGLFHMIMGLLLILCSYAIVNTLIIYLPSQDSPGGGLGKTGSAGTTTGGTTGGTTTGTTTGEETTVVDSGTEVRVPSESNITSASEVANEINSSVLDAVLSNDSTITDIKPTGDGGYKFGAVDPTTGVFTDTTGSYSGVYYPIKEITTNESVFSDIKVGGSTDLVFKLKVPGGQSAGAFVGEFYKDIWDSPVNITSISTPTSPFTYDSTDNLLTIPVTYIEAGDYIMKLLLVNEVGSIERDFTLKVAGLMPPSFSWEIKSEQLNKVHFETNNKYKDYTKVWTVLDSSDSDCTTTTPPSCSFDSEFGADSNNPIITFDSAGEYTVILKITDPVSALNYASIDEIVTIESIISLNGATVTDPGAIGAP